MRRTKITIVHDSFGHPSSLRKDWGFSALLEFDGQRILFDTGNSARTFSENCSALDLDLRNLDYAVISHRHGDHTSGLNHLLKVNPKLTVHTPEETYGVFGSSLFGSFILDAIRCLAIFSTRTEILRKSFVMAVPGRTRVLSGSRRRPKHPKALSLYPWSRTCRVRGRCEKYRWDCEHLAG
jgi:glyoxylase-like metal-dependent hydrolase (beta-lactamase superfamily II)